MFIFEICFEQKKKWKLAKYRIGVERKVWCRFKLQLLQNLLVAHEIFVTFSFCKLPLELAWSYDIAHQPSTQKVFASGSVFTLFHTFSNVSLFLAFPDFYITLHSFLHFFIFFIFFNFLNFYKFSDFSNSLTTFTYFSFFYAFHIWFSYTFPYFSQTILLYYSNFLSLFFFIFQMFFELSIYF